MKAILSKQMAHYLTIYPRTLHIRLLFGRINWKHKLTRMYPERRGK